MKEIGKQFGPVIPLIKLEGNAVNTGHVKEKDAETKVNTDQVTINPEVAEEKVLDPKATVNSVIDETASKLKDFLNDNPLWMPFAEGLLAGAAAGSITRKAEVSKEIADYMKKIKTNMERTYKKEGKLKTKNKIRDFLFRSTDLARGFSGLLGGSSLTVGNIFALSAHGESDFALILACVNAFGVGAIIAYNLLKTAEDRFEHPINIPSVSTKGDRYQPIGNNRFLTIPPASNKLLMCEINKDKNTGELYPTLIDREKLPDLPVSLDGSNEKWHDNWLKETVKRFGDKVFNRHDDYNNPYYKNYKDKDYDAKISYGNENISSRVHITSSNGMSIENFNRQEDLKRVQQSWDKLKDEIGNKE